VAEGRPSDVGLEATQAIRRARGVVILTGAGVSADSGVPTFRDPVEGLWKHYRPEDLATPGAFQRDPCLVWSWYDMRRQAVLDCHPNPGHYAIARFLLHRNDAVLVTQNVDGLHARALEEVSTQEKARGSSGAQDRMLHLHGDILTLRCSRCSYRERNRDRVDTSSEATLPSCRTCGALLRPAVVWFGEMLDQGVLNAAFEAAARAQVCLVAGTSAVVHPAASIPQATAQGGGSIVEVNPEETPLSRLAQWQIREGAGVALPRILSGVDEYS
jgi:NAD-dependent deacetylase